jgi:hypothetical protein
MDINYRPQRDDNTKNISKKKSSQNLSKPRSHLKIIHARRVISSKFFRDGPKILDPPPETLFALAIWRAVFMHSV